MPMLNSTRSASPLTHEFMRLVVTVEACVPKAERGAIAEALRARLRSYATDAVALLDTMELQGKASLTIQSAPLAEPTR